VAEADGPARDGGRARPDAGGERLTADRAGR
jgi:hypothetical protein